MQRVKLQAKDNVSFVVDVSWLDVSPTIKHQLNTLPPFDEKQPMASISVPVRANELQLMIRWMKIHKLEVDAELNGGEFQPSKEFLRQLGLKAKQCPAIDMFIAKPWERLLLNVDKNTLLDLAAIAKSLKIRALEMLCYRKIWYLTSDMDFEQMYNFYFGRQ